MKTPWQRKLGYRGRAAEGKKGQEGWGTWESASNSRPSATPLLFFPSVRLFLTATCKVQHIHELSRQVSLASIIGNAITKTNQHKFNEEEDKIVMIYRCQELHIFVFSLHIIYYEETLAERRQFPVWIRLILTRRLKGECVEFKVKPVDYAALMPLQWLIGKRQRIWSYKEILRFS